ncbi:MAG TPA: hypothetical protein VGI88_13820, partial [Verrucomicrobiae bacterium]
GPIISKAAQPSGVFPPFLQNHPEVKSIAPTDSQPPSREGGFFLPGTERGASLRAPKTAQKYLRESALQH